LKLLCESHLRWGTFLPNLDTLGLWVLELFAMYATDGLTDGQKQRLLPPSLQYNRGLVSFIWLLIFPVIAKKFIQNSGGF